MQLKRALAGTWLLASLSGAAAAAPRVAIAPLATLGAESRGTRTRAISERLREGVASLAEFEVVAGKELAAAIAAAKRPELRACDGDPDCLAALGEVVGARYVVYGELGGLGAAEVLAVKVVDVSARRELRSTTAAFTGEAADRDEARAAAVRLLAPDRYTGTMAIAVDVAGAAIYVDGTEVAHSPSPPIRAEVGNHALRVTHPEYRDYVRFVDVPFDGEIRLDVPLLAYPIIDREVEARGAVRVAGPTSHEPRATPWYRRWYTVAGASAAVFIVSALVTGATTGGIDADATHTVEP
jgi:TolB-like protein